MLNDLPKDVYIVLQALCGSASRGLGAKALPVAIFCFVGL